MKPTLYFVFEVSTFSAFNYAEWLPFTSFFIEKRWNSLFTLVFELSGFPAFYQSRWLPPTRFFQMEIPRNRLNTPDAFSRELLLGFFKAPLIIYFSGFLIVQNRTGSVYGHEKIFATCIIRLVNSSQLFVVPSNCLYVGFFVDKKNLVQRENTFWKIFLFNLTNQFLSYHCLASFTLHQYELPVVVLRQSFYFI